MRERTQNYFGRMQQAKNHWGVLVFVPAVLCVGTAFFLLIRYPPGSYRVLHERVVPVAGVVLSILSFCVGHFSYPRVHSLKVYLLGDLVGLNGLFYFLLLRTMAHPRLPVGALLLLMFLNFAAVVFLPSYVKYRITRRITLTFVLVECLLLGLVRGCEWGWAWVGTVAAEGMVFLPVSIGILWLCLILAGTVVKLRGEFHLGGVLSGGALVYLAAWLCPVVFEHADASRSMMLAIAPLYLEIAILVHWFSRMEHRISHDPLLHIYNRNFCSRVIEEQSSVRTTPPLGVAMVDIDYFKNVNDKHGHQTGDKVLFLVAQTILRGVVPDGIACRYGGEEIIIFFPQLRTRDIVPVMEKIREEVQGIRVPGTRKNMSVTISCGISCREVKSQSIVDVIKNADKALYRAKSAGRNRTKAAKTPLAASKGK